jgi:uncharacterized membrane protein YdjX (TVP38/TMEM64 family)
MRLKRKFNKKDAATLVIILLLLCLLTFLSVRYYQLYDELKGDGIIETAANFRDYLRSFGRPGIAVLILLHIFQTAVAFIPASFVQFAAGMLYGILPAMVIGAVGVAAGTCVTFTLSRKLGRDFATLFISEKTMEQLEGLMDKNASALILLILFIIPFPKDVLPIFVGLTRMPAAKLYVISALGRLPGMFVASYLGANALSRNYVLLITVFAVCVASAIAAYFLRNKLIGANKE